MNGLDRLAALGLAAAVAACAPSERDTALPPSPDTTRSTVVDTQIIKDPSGVELMIITGKRVEEVEPRKGSGDPDAPGAIQLLSADEVGARIEGARPPWYVIDVRTAAEYAGAGHLRRAALFPLDRLEENIEDLHIRSDQYVLVYGATTEQGLAAARLLAGYGFPNLLVMRGGYGAWRRKGLSEERDEP